ncbi:uncharacterized protein LOC116766643 isoform X2 [Danaus plexippus]|uniref:uncharacterized protein LOC116766643 isoform X2 n=1 Tax=Danaus plexippus TaxID=13037 RepID=UPI002AB24A37|nr:uncharacterized protein LOC116766643 isoform X2 [Danaus plexippus]
MMHMWMWFGYDLGDFLFSGLVVNTRWSFALTWIVLFFVALLFEGSKVYLARVQREALRKLRPHGSDERRNLLCERDREQANAMEATTSRNTSSGQVSKWDTFKIRTLVNGHQTLVFVVHNVVGYLLMLAVMIYNVHLMLAVVFGMMLGYFLFGTKLTRLQMQCFSTKRVVICTPECDDTAENSTPPLLNTSMDSQSSDIFVCQTRTCIQPSHYFPANTQDGGEHSNASCYYGAKRCPSKVAKFKKMQSGVHCHHDSEKEDSPGVEDAQLLHSERRGCCKKLEPPPEEQCCKSSQNTTVVIHEESHSEDADTQSRENSPQISCCHSKSTRDSQEQIVT